MRNVRLLTLTIAVAPALVAIACSGEDAAPGIGGSAGAAGNGGASGSSGAAGAAGAAGSTGKGGNGGSATDGGSGGKAGAGGTAGTTGSGGSAGSSGTGGKGGAAGTTDSGAGGTTGVDASADRAGDGRLDATSDAPTGDGNGGAPCSSGPAQGDDCDDYCGTWFDVCQPIAMWATTYANKDACVAACETWADAKLCCRAEHVQLADDAGNMSEASTHCGHAVGVNSPPACAN